MIELLIDHWMEIGSVYVVVGFIWASYWAGPAFPSPVEFLAHWFLFPISMIVSRRPLLQSKK